MKEKNKSGILRRLNRNIDKGIVDYNYNELSDNEIINNSESDYDDFLINKRKVSHKDIKEKHKKSKKIKKIDLEEEEKNLEENVLFKKLTNPDVDVSELILEWIGRFESDKSENYIATITEIINLILRSCGSLQLFHEHDLINLDSVEQTIEEMTDFLRKQESHFFIFKTSSRFRKNILDFFTKFIETGHEKGFLYLNEDVDDVNTTVQNERIIDYDDDPDEKKLISEFMNYLMTWLFSLNSCYVRSLRYVSSMIICVFQNEFCHIINIVSTSIYKTQKQISKTNENSTKYLVLNKTMKTLTHQKDCIIEYLNEISSITISHRYRDIDPLIRQEIIKSLSQSMILYSDYFFQNHYLRYFGTLLFDSTSFVRLEVMKVMLKLYKEMNSFKSAKNNINIGMRQFTERNKQQIILMAMKDIDFQIRMTSISICCELLKIGFLDESDNYEIISIFFYLYCSNLQGVVLKVKFDKEKIQQCKFISLVIEQNLAKLIDKHSMVFENILIKNVENRLMIENCLKIKILRDLINKTIKHLKEQNQKIDFLLNDFVVELYCSLCQASNLEIQTEFLLNYFIHNCFFIKFNDDNTNSESDKQFQEIKDLENEIKIDDNSFYEYLSNLIFGSLKFLILKSNQKQDQTILTLNSIVKYFVSFQDLSMKSNCLLTTFLKIWNFLINITDENINMFNIFNSMGHNNVFVEVNMKLLNFYQLYDSSDENYLLFEEYNNFFSVLFRGYEVIFDSNCVNILTSEIKLEIQIIIKKIIEKVKIEINSQDENKLLISNDQNKFIVFLISLNLLFLKLRNLSNTIDINEFMLDSTQSPAIIITVLDYLNIIDFNLLIDKCSESNLNDFLKFIKNFMNFVLICSFWKFEKIAYQITNNELNEKEKVDFKSIFMFENHFTNIVLKLFFSLFEVLEKYFKHENLIESLSSTLDQKKKIFMTYKFLTILSSQFIDFITSAKIFNLKFKDNTSITKGFLDDFQIINKYINNQLPIDFQKKILQIFLYKESILSNYLNIELERDSDEIIDYNFLFNDEFYVEIEENDNDVFFSDNENNMYHTDVRTNNNQKKKDKVTWMLEIDLCFFTLKVFLLINTYMVDDFILKRIQSNASKINGVFLKITNKVIDKPNFDINENINYLKNATNEELENLNFKKHEIEDSSLKFNDINILSSPNNNEISLSFNLDND